jgi:hypothetical protein
VWDLRRGRDGDLRPWRRRLSHLPRLRIRSAAWRRPSRVAAANYAAGLVLTGLAVYWTVVQTLPATVAWASHHGWAGWVPWLVWAGCALTGLDLTLRRGVYPAVYVLHVTGITAVWMTIAGPWPHPVLGTLAGLYGWLLAYLAARHTARHAAWHSPTPATPVTSVRTRP